MLYFHANENNLIDFPNSLADNVMLSIETRTSEFSINFSEIDYSPFLYEVDIAGNVFFQLFFLYIVDSKYYWYFYVPSGFGDV